MNLVIPITEFRKRIFELTDKLVQSGGEIEVEKEGVKVWRITPVDDSPAERAKQLLELAKKLGGIWKDVPESEFKKINEYMRGKKEKLYLNRLRKKW